MCCTRDGLFCVSGGISGSLYLFSVSSGELLRTWNGHYKAVTSIQFNDDCSYFVTGGLDAILHVWTFIDIMNNINNYSNNSNNG